LTSVNVQIEFPAQRPPAQAQRQTASREQGQ
jgi:hypothetical protein